MNEKEFAGRSPYSLSTDVEDIVRVIQTQITNEDPALALDFIHVLLVRVERLELKLREELT